MAHNPISHSHWPFLIGNFIDLNPQVRRGIHKLTDQTHSDLSFIFIPFNQPHRLQISHIFTACCWQITLDNQKKVSVIWISRCENVQRDPPSTPAWLVLPNICFNACGGELGAPLKSRFWKFWRFYLSVYMTVVTLEWSRRCSWIEWSLLTPLIPLVRSGSQFQGPRGRYTNTICNCCKIGGYIAPNTCLSWKLVDASLPIVSAH